MYHESFDACYETKERYNSYWHQVHEVSVLDPASVLEIGIGSGFLSHALRRKGICTTTLDIDPALQPDVVGSATEIPFGDSSFDVVVCFQVLEHLEYPRFAEAVREIRRVTRKSAVLSLPDLGRVYKFLVQLPRLGELKLLIPVPRIKPLRWEYNGEHHWNIGCAGYPLKRVLADIEAEGFVVQRHYRVFEMPWHRFIVLEKR